MNSPRPLLIDSLFWPLLLLTLVAIALFEYGPERQLNVLERERVSLARWMTAFIRGAPRPACCQMSPLVSTASCAPTIVTRFAR